jgi:hypothetical protein
MDKPCVNSHWLCDKLAFGSGLNLKQFESVSLRHFLVSENVSPRD